MTSLSRRELLSWSGAALATLGCWAATPVSAPRRVRLRQKPHVVVVGAGIAGLAAALALVEKEIDVTILEAQQRAGGRILTIRSPFYSGLYVEAGAAHVVGDPALLGLIEKLGLSLTKPSGRAAELR